MAYWEEDERDEFDDAPREIATCVLAEPGPCCMCGKPGCTYGCFSCGHPVCYSSIDYFDDTECGSWILDTWHPGHPHENEFYCKNCLNSEKASW